MNNWPQTARAWRRLRWAWDDLLAARRRRKALTLFHRSLQLDPSVVDGFVQSALDQVVDRVVDLVVAKSDMGKGIDHGC